MSTELDLLVTGVATKLMAADAATARDVSRRVLADLVRAFELDFSFLRHNDHEIRASKLIAEWPVRENVPDPDPIGVVHFEGADPVFALAEHAKEIHIFRPEPTSSSG